MNERKKTEKEKERIERKKELRKKGKKEAGAPGRHGGQP